jgi:hypothetical protein
LLCLSHLTRGREFDPLVFRSPVNREDAIRITRKWDSDACWEFHKLVVFHLFDVYTKISDQAAGQLYEPIIEAFMDHAGSGMRGRQILPVITTNYDRCIEGAVAQWNRAKADQICLVDGFLHQSPQGQYGPVEGREEWAWAPSVHFRGDMDVINARTGEVVLPVSPSQFLAEHFWERPGVRLFMPYFKIHGSFNWIYNGSMLFQIEEENWLWHREELPLYETLRSIDWPLEPGIRPYLWEPGNKEWFTNAYQQVAYTFFREALKYVDTFIFVGYSFRDQHLLDALSKGLRENHSALIVAIDPVPTLNSDLQRALDGHRVVHIATPLSEAGNDLRHMLSAT